MSYQEIARLTLEDLKFKLAEEKRLLRKLKFANKTVRIENPGRIKTSRRLIARFKTAEKALRASNASGKILSTPNTNQS